MFVLTILFQVCLAFVLIAISGAIGKLSLSRGYSSLTNSTGTDSLSFNFFYRVLFLPVLLSLVSMGLYLAGAEILVRNIWIVAIWYNLIHLLASIRKLPYANIYLYFFSAITSILISLAFYLYGISRGLDNLLPDEANFRTEIWFIIFIFFYELFKNKDCGFDRQKFQTKLENKYLFLKNKYSYLLEEEFKTTKILNDLLFSIMIFEDMNRPKWIRLIENWLYKLGKSKTTGIMQVGGRGLLNDESSVVEAQKLILDEYNKYNITDSDILSLVITSYNPDAYYREEVKKLYYEIQQISWRLEEDKSSTEEQLKPDQNIDNQLRTNLAELGKLMLQISEPAKKPRKKINES